MSSQRGNVKRERGQKHQNRTAFKNTLHDTSHKTKIINNIEATGCCARCKEVIEWKIKYKKYKILSQPKKCVKCEQKTVKKNYYVICDPCAAKHEVCAKCGQKKDLAVPRGLSAAEEASQKSQLEMELKMLKERQRRTFHRLHESGKLRDLHEGQPDAAMVGENGGDYSDSDVSNEDPENNRENDDNHPSQSLSENDIDSLSLSDETNQQDACNTKIVTFQ